MRRFMGLALVAGLWLGYGSAANAQMGVMGYTPYPSPYMSVGVGAPYGLYGGGMYPYGGLGTTYYSSGYSGVGLGMGSPLTTYYSAPGAVYSYSYGYPVYTYRRGLFGGYRVRAW